MSTVRYWMVGHGGFHNRGCEAIVRGSLDTLVEARLERMPHSCNRRCDADSRRGASIS